MCQIPTMEGPQCKESTSLKLRLDSHADVTVITSKAYEKIKDVSQSVRIGHINSVNGTSSAEQYEVKWNTGDGIHQDHFTEAAHDTACIDKRYILRFRGSSGTSAKRGNTEIRCHRSRKLDAIDPASFVDKQPDNNQWSLWAQELAKKQTAALANGIQARDPRFERMNAKAATIALREGDWVRICTPFSQSPEYGC